MKNFRSSIVTPLLLVLAGCSNYSANPNDTRPGLVPAPGSVIVLNQAIDVHPGFSRSFIQQGRGVRQQELDEREPWCQFRLYEPPAALRTTRTIRPDRFVISKSYRVTETFAQAYPTVASTGLRFLLNLEHESREHNLSNIMRIHSSEQPRVIEFKCAIFAEPELRNYVSIRQMRQTLGEIVSFELKPVG